MKNITLLLSLLLVLACSRTPQKEAKPNVIIIFTDDQGYEDLGCFNSPLIKTPNLDEMANNGIRFTDFYVTNSICSPSRAGLLTGRYGFRNGVTKVFFPDEAGLDSSEVTIAEMLKTSGYKTACFGKWHLGDKPENLPLNQGFDEYFGIPYSNDMYIGQDHTFSKDVVFREGYNMEKAQADQALVKETNHNWKKMKESGLGSLSPLFKDNEIVEYPCDQSTLTQRYFEHAMAFIEKNKEQPFFVYLTPAMPHVPLFASEKFKGKSERGLYGDVVEEIDDNVGRLLSYLKSNQLDENTIVIFTSDNGPWLSYKELAGSAFPLRDGKFSCFEGGVRVPCIMRWTGKWDAKKVSNQVVSTIDLLPTIAHYSKSDLPQKQLDGLDIHEHLENTSSLLPERSYLYSSGKTIRGIRMGEWKYLKYGGYSKFSTDSLPALYNLNVDISEETNVIDEFPEIAKKLDSIIMQVNY